LKEGYHPHAAHRDPGNRFLKDKLNVKINKTTYRQAYEYLERISHEIQNEPNHHLRYILEGIIKNGLNSIAKQIN